MWLDDDGEDDPIPGPVPDPSTRHWRHPSELAAERAGAAQAMAGAGSRSAMGSVLWPITVVGGSIAIAAFGVLGLYLMGGSPTGEITAGGSADPASGLRNQLPVTSEARPASLGVSAATIAPVADPGGAVTDGDDAVTAGDDAVTAGDEPATDEPRTGGTTKSATGRDGGPGAPAPESLATLDEPLAARLAAAIADGPAIYADVRPGTEPLASFVLTDRAVISSASALRGRATVYLRVEGRWILGSVVAADLPSDVALVQPTVDLTELGVPRLRLAPTSVTSGTVAYMGYCQTDIDPTRAKRSDTDADAGAIVGGTGDGGAVAGDRSEGDQTAEGADETGTPAEPAAPVEAAPGCGAAEEPGTAASAADPDAGAAGEQPAQDTDTDDPASDQAATAAEESAPAENGWADGRRFQLAEEQAQGRATKAGPPPAWPSGAGTGAESAWQDDGRSGKVYSTLAPVETLADHTIYEPIRAGIQRSTGVASGPLRDRSGRLVGLILGSSEVLVSALPIDRAIEVADSLLDWGYGSPAWVGIDGKVAEDGFVISGVHDTSPAADLLAPGDVLLTVNGQRLLDQDHLTHLVRDAGPDGTLHISYREGGGRWVTAEIVVASVPAE